MRFTELIYLFTFYTISFMILPANLFAEAPDISGLETQINLVRHISYFEDKGAGNTIQSILNSQPGELQWTKNKGERLGFGFSSSAYWLKFKLKNTGDQVIRVNILQEYPLIDYLDMYIVQDGVVVEEFRYGDQYKFSRRRIKYRSFVFPLSLAPAQGVSVYVRYYSQSSVNANLTLWKPEAFREFKDNEAIGLWIYYGLIISLLFYNFFIFLSTKDLSYLWYIIYVSSYALMTMGVNGLGFQYLWPDSIWWGNNCITIFMYCLVFTILLFSRDFIGIKKYSKPAFHTFSVMAGLTCLLLMADFLLPSYRLRMILAMVWGLLNISLCFPIVLYLTWKHRLRSGVYFGMAFLFFFTGAFLFASKIFNILPSNFITNYAMQMGSAIEVVLLSLGLADRINVMKKELEVLNVDLEEKVQERTTELSQSLETVQQLKMDQDGDYYLTALLLNPMQSRSNHPGSVTTEIIVNQLKEFSFRDRGSELGGDLCMTGRLSLKNREYVFFTNADAMGKSMQGAGGALVFGTAIRSRLVAAKGLSLENTPELWLEELFNELQGLFESFEGSMYISAVIGLLDEKTGWVTYVNAEHPWVCLFRDGQAGFIEGETSNPKLGTSINRRVKLKYLQLQTGDKLILGSDGKDDIMLGGENPEINFDEMLFLTWVNKAQGNLEQTAKLIKKAGKLKDDISMLGLTWNNNKGALALELDDSRKKYLAQAREFIASGEGKAARSLLLEMFQHTHINKEVMTLFEEYFLSEKLFKEHYNLKMRYYDLFPWDNDNLYELSQAAYNLNRFTESALWSESLLLRDPNKEENLTLLAQIYGQQGNRNKAAALIRLARKLFPDSELQYEIAQILSQGSLSRQKSDFLIAKQEGIRPESFKYM